jgi:hypothetical protein
MCRESFFGLLGNLELLVVILVFAPSHVLKKTPDTMLLWRTLIQIFANWKASILYKWIVAPMLALYEKRFCEILMGLEIIIAGVHRNAQGGEMRYSGPHDIDLADVEPLSQKWAPAEFLFSSSVLSTLVSVLPVKYRVIVENAKTLFPKLDLLDELPPKTM